MVNEGGLLGAEFHEAPASKARGVRSLTRDASADVAAGKCHSAARFVGAIKANVGSRCGDPGLAKVASCLVTKLLGTLGHAKFLISFGKANQTGFVVVERFTVYVEVVVMVDSADPIGVLTLEVNIARKE